MSKLKIAGVTIKNVLGIEELELHPDGNVVQIMGGNGKGKSSILQAFKGALGISDYSNLVRNGAESGEVVIDLNDMVIKKKFKSSGADTLTLQGRVAGTDAMSNISSPAKVLKGLFSPTSVDPLALLAAKPKDLLDAVLNASPMTVKGTNFNTIIDGRNIDTDCHALIAIAEAQKVITEDRRDINRDLKNAQTTATQLQGTLPDELPDTSEIHSAIDNNNAAIEGIQSESRKAGRAVRQQYTEQIQTLESRIEDLEEALAEAKADKAVLVREQELKVEQAQEDVLSKGDELYAENDLLQQQLQSMAVFENTKKQIAGWNEQVKAAQLQSNKMTKALDDLQSLKEDLCKDLPIEGLEIKDGMLCFNGVQFQTLNTAAKVKLVVKLAELSAGDLGLIVIDNSEALDAKTYELFIEEASKSDLMFVVARVTEGDLTIK
jgi:DNA repair exonuclease SbcCD ATPase subunit